MKTTKASKTKEHKKNTEEIHLSDNLQKLSEISHWFEEQTELHIEEGLIKVKEASILIKESRGKLKEIENEFIEIKKSIEEDEL